MIINFSPERARGRKKLDAKGFSRLPGHQGGVAD
jgi:hypothetical protein